MGDLSLAEGLPGGVPPCGQGGSLSDGGGELIAGSRGGGCLNTDDSVWLLWEDFSSGECLGDGRGRASPKLTFWLNIYFLKYVLSKLFPARVLCV